MPRRLPVVAAFTVSRSDDGSDWTKPSRARPTCEARGMELAEGVAVDDDKVRFLCAQYGIRSLRLFGSALHGTLRPDSDIDLLVEFERDRTPGLL